MKPSLFKALENFIRIAANLTDFKIREILSIFDYENLDFSSNYLKPPAAIIDALHLKLSEIKSSYTNKKISKTSDFEIDSHLLKKKTIWINKTKELN